MLPPALTGKPPVGNSPATSGSGNPGLAANALAQVREAVKILTTALANVPMGTEAHKAILDSIQKLSKAAPANEAAPGQQQSTVRDLAQKQQTMAPMEALMRSLTGGQGGQPQADAA